MTNLNTYIGEFVNQEFQAGTNIPFHLPYRITIYDQESEIVDNPFGFSYRVTGRMAVVNFTSSPGGAHTKYFGWSDNGGSTWVDIPVGDAPPYTFTINPANAFSLRIDYETGTDTRYILSNTGTETELEMADTPLVISVIDNDEDPFTPRRAKQAEILIHTSTEIGIADFASGGDNRFYVEIENIVGGEQPPLLLFRGFLSIGDLQQDFQPDPNTLSLVATDGLGFLDDEPLVNFDGEVPQAEHQVIKYIAWALALSGQKLDIEVRMNVRARAANTLNEDSTGIGHFMSYTYLDARTFEDEIGTLLPAGDVLDRILGEMMYAAQWRGNWQINRVDEIARVGDYEVFVFDWEGNFKERRTESAVRSIGAGLQLSWMNDDAIVGRERPYKTIIEEFRLETPLELVCNQDFSRGEIIIEPDYTAGNSTGTQEVECWQMHRYGVDDPPTSEAYIEASYVYGTEETRHVVVTPAADSNHVEWLQSSPIEVQIKDKATISVDFATPIDIGASTGNVNFAIFNVWIRAVNGDYWYWSHLDEGGSDMGYYRWTGPFSAEQNRPVEYAWVLEDIDETAFRTVTATTSAFPASGKMYIGLYQLNQSADAFNDQNVFFNNLQIDYISFVNGSYRLFSSQQHIVSSTSNGVKAKREKEVYISDAPNRQIKGALLGKVIGAELFTGTLDFNEEGTVFLPGNVTSDFAIGMEIIVSGTASNNIEATITDVGYNLIGNQTYLQLDVLTTTENDVTGTINLIDFGLLNDFYDAAENPDGPPERVMSFGELQSFDVWNQFRRTICIFDGTIDGLNGFGIPDLHHKYALTDADENTNNRTFQLLHFEQDHHLVESSIYLRECFNSEEGKSYEGHEFKYVQE